PAGAPGVDGHGSGAPGVDGHGSGAPGVDGHGSGAPGVDGHGSGAPGVDGHGSAAAPRSDPLRACVIEPDHMLPGGLYGFSPANAVALRRRGEADAWRALEGAGWIETVAT